VLPNVLVVPPASFGMAHTTCATTMGRADAPSWYTQATTLYVAAVVGNPV
jgi:hypothetical protein